MEKLLGKRHHYTKKELIKKYFILSFLFLFTGSFINISLFLIYLASVKQYENHALLGFSSNPYPISPIYAYIIIGAITVSISIFLLFLPLIILNKQKKDILDVILFDDEANTLKISSKNTYYTIALSDISETHLINYKYRRWVTKRHVLLAEPSDFLIPVPYGNIIIKYKSNNELIKLKSDRINSVNKVYKEIKKLILDYEDNASK